MSTATWSYFVLNVPVNNFPVMSRQFSVFVGLTSTKPFFMFFTVIFRENLFFIYNLYQNVFKMQVVSGVIRKFV